MKALVLIAAAALALSPSLRAKDKDHHPDPRHGGVDAAKAKAQANVLSGKDKGAVTLGPARGNVMNGEAAFALRSDAKIVLSFTPSQGKAEQVRFQLGAMPDHKGHKH